MPNHSRTTIAQQLNLAQTAISNTLSDAEIQGLVDAFGYPAEKMKANIAKPRMVGRSDLSPRIGAKPRHPGWSGAYNSNF